MRPSRPALLGAAALAGACVVTTLAVPAAAAPTASARPVVHTAAGVTPAAAAKDNVQSGVAGYVTGLGSATRHSLTASFKVPRVVCPGGTVDPLFLNVYLFGTDPTTDEFAYVTGGVTISCTQRVPSYQAFAGGTSGQNAGAVSPGDTLAVKLSTTTRSIAAQLTDVTSGGVFRWTDGGATDVVAQVSAQGGFGDNPFPRSGPIRFAGVKPDGAALATYPFTAFDQVDNAGTVVLTTSGLDASGTGFTITPAT